MKTSIEYTINTHEDERDGFIRVHTEGFALSVDTNGKSFAEVIEWIELRLPEIKVIHEDLNVDTLLDLTEMDYEDAVSLIQEVGFPCEDNKGDYYGPFIRAIGHGSIWALTEEQFEDFNGWVDCGLDRPSFIDGLDIPDGVYLSSQIVVHTDDGDISYSS